MVLGPYIWIQICFVFQCFRFFLLSGVWFCLGVWVQISDLLCGHLIWLFIVGLDIRVYLFWIVALCFSMSRLICSDLPLDLLPSFAGGDDFLPSICRRCELGESVVKDSHICDWLKPVGSIDCPPILGGFLLLSLAYTESYLTHLVCFFALSIPLSIPLSMMCLCPLRVTTESLRISVLILTGICFFSICIHQVNITEHI